MHTDIWFRGGKKFGHLLLVQPYLSVIRCSDITNMSCFPYGLHVQIYEKISIMGLFFLFFRKNAQKFGS